MDSFEVDIEQEHLFHLVSEIDPRNKKAKGGYLEGKIKLPEFPLMKVVLSTRPTSDIPEDLLQEYPQLAEYSPCCLNHVWKTGGRVQYEKTPVTNVQHFKQQFLIRENTVLTKTVTTELDEGRMHQPPDWERVTEIGSDNILHLGKTKNSLKLQVIYPKSTDTNKDDHLTVDKMLHHQGLPNHFSELFKADLKKVQIHVELQIPLEDGTWVPEGTRLSRPIISRRSKEFGAFKLYDRIPHSACSAGGSKVALISELALPKDVLPMFQLWNSDTGERVSEAEERVLLNNQFEAKIDYGIVRDAVIFHAPAQPNMEQIMLKNYKFKLAALRKSDDAITEGFSFTYQIHNSCTLSVAGEPTPVCMFCFFAQSENIYSVPVAGPGNNKRTMPQSDEKAAKTPRMVSQDCWCGRVGCEGGCVVVAQDAFSPDSGIGQSPQGACLEEIPQDLADVVPFNDPMDGEAEMPEIRNEEDRWDENLLNKLPDLPPSIMPDGAKPRSSKNSAIASASKNSLPTSRPQPMQSVLHDLADILASEEGVFASWCLVIMLLILKVSGKKTQERDNAKVFQMLLSELQMLPVILGIILGVLHLCDLGDISSCKTGTCQVMVTLVLGSLVCGAAFVLTVLFRRLLNYRA